MFPKHLDHHGMPVLQFIISAGGRWRSLSLFVYNAGGAGHHISFMTICENKVWKIQFMLQCYVLGNIFPHSKYCWACMCACRRKKTGRSAVLSVIVGKISPVQAKYSCVYDQTTSLPNTSHHHQLKVDQEQRISRRSSVSPHCVALAAVLDQEQEVSRSLAK